MQNDAYERRFPGLMPSNGGGSKLLNGSRTAVVSNGRVTAANGSSSSGYFSGHSSTEEGALYTVDHLATFTVGESYELVHPRDGLRRLRQMEKSSGIWTQRMYLRVETNWIVIIDFENGDTVERFPLELVHDPTHFISADPKELYNNILLFTVKEDPRSKGASFSEMHIFHCLKTSAEKIADSISLLVRSSNKSSLSKRSKDIVIPPPPSNPPPEPPTGVSVKDRVNELDNIRFEPNGQRLNGGRTYLLREDDSESQRSDATNYERDVAILNHCFDDIERFIARLQYASAAYKELERRRRQRKSKKKEIGDGMLQMKARAPAETEFADIFQKFKLSFNLLGKLRSHIHDPNAPELVHFLFTPLALVVDASHDAEYGPNLAARVVSPLLSLEAKNLLLNCLSSKESDLWSSLGDSWMQTRSEYAGHVPSYTPVFHDGWQPGATYPEGAEKLSTRTDTWKDDYEAESSADYPFGEDRLDYRKGTTPSPSPRQYTERDRQSDFSDGLLSDNDFEKRQKRFTAELAAVGAQIVQVQYPRTGKNDKELSVQQGEILQLLNDTRKWWQTRNSRGQTGYVPHTIVVACHADEAFSSYPPPSTRNHRGSNGRDRYE